ncbi:MAG: hypothetical protein GWN00_01225 [Aliifodinibius sp.]|nr:hypothetical protein [Fodinibius sp.]NIV09953.1 hypothetical protein [Fodinibius sp.]NIY23483.1 hypothetical protein [Fodinibius sp.]
MSWMDRQEKNKKSNRHGRVSESQMMKKLGATSTPGSGALPSAKSDGFDDAFQYEHKSTIHKSYGLKLETIRKIEKEALDVGRDPVLSISFVNPTGESIPQGDYVVISKELFQSLVSGDLIKCL